MQFVPLQTLPLIGGGVVLLVIIVTVVQAVEIVGENERRVVIVFGKFQRVLEPGINLVPPFIGWTVSFDMRTQSIDLPHQEVETSDDHTVTVAGEMEITVIDAKTAFMALEDYKQAATNLGQTTVRAVIGDIDLDEIQFHRQDINERICAELNGATDEWGVRFESVELTEVTPVASDERQRSHR